MNTNAAAAAAIAAAVTVAGSAIPTVALLVLGGITTLARWNMNVSSTLPTVATMSGMITIPLTAGQQISMSIYQPTTLGTNAQTLLGNQVMNTYPFLTWFSGVYVGA